MLDPKLEVHQVLLGDGRNADRDAGDVQPVVVRQNAALQYLADDMHPIRLEYLELDQAIVDQDLIAGVDLGGQAVIVDRRDPVCPLHLAGGQCELITGVDRHRAATKQAQTNLRTLQVLQDRHRPVFLDGELPPRADRLAMLFQGSVREVQPGHVHSRIDQSREHLRLATGRADRAYDLGPSLCHRGSASSIMSDSGQTGWRASRAIPAPPRSEGADYTCRSAPSG